MPGKLTFGLNLLGGNPNLTFIAFVGMALLSVIACRFGAYAYLNMRATEVGTQRVLWEYLVAVGTVATFYGLVGILEVVSSIRATFKQGVMLGFVLLLALAIREIYVNSALSTGDGGRVSGRLLGAVERLFVVVVGVVTVGIAVGGPERPLFLLQGASALAFAGYGFWFGRRQTAQSMVQGTMIDSLLRHLLPVMAFAMLVPAVDLATVAGLPRIVVMHVQVIFVIMTATALMTATIKLRQNLASL